MNTVALGSVATIERKGVDPRAIPPETLYIGLEHIERGGRIIGHDTVAGAELASTKFQFSPEHVLFGKLRPNLGKVSRPDFDGVCSTDILPIRPGNGLDRNYLAHYLVQPSMVDFAASRASGANLPRLSPTVLATFPIPLPPLPEQRRIAAILDHADALRTKRRQVLAHLDSLSQSIFQDMFGSTSCVSVPLGSLVDFYSGGTPSKSRKDYWEGDVPWFSAKDLKAPDLWESQDHIAGKVTRETSLRLLPRDTITMVVRGMILAHTIPVTTLRVPATINQDLKALLPRGSIDVDFLSAAIRARSGWILGRVSTAAHGTRKLESSILDSIPIPDAESRLQTAFSQRAAQVNLQREIAARALAASSELFASLQSRAFRGEL